MVTDWFTDGQDEEFVKEEASFVSVEWKCPEAPSSVEQQFAAAVLKLEYLVQVPGEDIDDFY